MWAGSMWEGKACPHADPKHKGFVFCSPTPAGWPKGGTLFISWRTVFERSELVRPFPLGSPGLVAWPSSATGTGEKAGSV